MATSFGCSESANGPGLSSCKDSNGGTSPGALNTSTIGSHTYTVTATSSDGQTGTASISYTVAGPPTASIGSPANGGTYNLNQVVATSFSCSESANGPGLSSCKDSNGSSSPGALNTSTVGSHSYTVTATSSDGQTGTASISYTVAGPPSARISSPAGGQTYNLGQSVATRFSCSEAAGGPGISSCLDSNGSTSPGALDTSTAGSHTYTVTALSSDGQTGTASISYTVVGPPSASITSPANNQTYSINQSVATSFGCSEAPGGPGLSSCVDSNGSSSPGALDTSTAGTFSYTVTAMSTDGQTGTASISYTVVGPPTASIASPASGGTYNLGQVVATSFSCSEALGGPGLSFTTCLDSNGSSSPGALDTSTVGSHSYTVTAMSTDGQTGTASISYTVVGPPSASITSPANNQTYNINQSVATSFGCSEAPGGPGLSSCVDSNGSSSPGALDTSTVGSHTYTVTARSQDGQTGTASISYTVVGPPSASITSPANNQTYNINQSVATSFGCSEAPGGPGLSSCVDSNGSSSPGALDTSTVGSHTYTVTARSQDGQTGTASISYTVAGPPSAQISSPAGGGTYNLNQSVATSFGCSESANGPGLSSCKDSNGSTSPGALNTSTVGSHTYTVTATSSDGQTGTASISYTVAGPPTASIGSPANGGTYNLYQVAATSFSCSESANGPGSARARTRTAAPNPGALNTSTVGSHSLTATATSTMRQTGTVSIHTRWLVVADGEQWLSAAVACTTSKPGRATSFSCSEALGGPGLSFTSCLDRMVRSSPGGA